MRMHRQNHRCAHWGDDSRAISAVSIVHLKGDRRSVARRGPLLHPSTFTNVVFCVEQSESDVRSVLPLVVVDRVPVQESSNTETALGPQL
jgi:hypothetical protein